MPSGRRRSRRSSVDDRSDDSSDNNDGRGGRGGRRGRRDDDKENGRHNQLDDDMGGMHQFNNSNSGPTVMFNVSKNEAVTPQQQQYKALMRRLRNHYNVTVNQDDISADRLDGVACFVLGAPTEALSQDECTVLARYLRDGGSVVVLSDEGSDAHHADVVNALTESYGITVNNDSCVRSVQHETYFHPKECYVRNAQLVQRMVTHSEKNGPNYVPKKFGSAVAAAAAEPADRLDIVYSFGATLTVAKPALPLITSGDLSFPAQRALLAVSTVKGAGGGGGGRLVVCGSHRLFNDEYVTKEDNAALATAVFRVAINVDGKCRVDGVDADAAEYQKTVQVPDIEALAERTRCCLEEPGEPSADFTSLFDHGLFKFDTNLINDAVQLYTKLGVKHEPLSLIPPNFEVPLPPLQPAVFMPMMREMPAPALDLFDLDQHFSTETLKLAQLTNKCSDSDLSYYVQEAGDILGVVDDVKKQQGLGDEARVSPSQILQHVLLKLINYKKLEQDQQQNDGDSGNNNNGGNNMMSMNNGGGDGVGEL